ncbi:MAG TPA: dihydroorotase [Candidatus Baltobacteraceae bacterium]|nr:dihydroorotase [Candidatus Baltobacteraceae bacterium]
MIIRNGHVVDPSQSLDRILDIRIENGRIAELGEHLKLSTDERAIDASGAYVAPGFIDMHVHLRDPGNPEKETLATGTAAAVAGGFTAVAAMPNTNPPLDTPDLVRYVAHAEPSGEIACRVYPIACITAGRKGELPAEYADLALAGAVAFSDDGSTVMNARVLYEAALAAKEIAGAFIVHCEDVHLKGSAFRNSHANALAEDTIVARDLEIAQASGKAWHIAHLSTANALASVRESRSRGVRVTCEVAPHHLVFTDEAIDRLGSRAKVNPPLRSQQDVDALRAGVLDGTIDVFATDHAPHTEGEKTADVSCGAVGFTGLEVAVGAYAFALPSLAAGRFVELLSTNPARILGVPGGTLAVGSPADVTIFADRPWKVEPSKLRSKGKSTPFAGMTLPRRVLATIVGGVPAYEYA